MSDLPENKDMLLHHYALLPDLFQPERLTKVLPARNLLELLYGLRDDGLIANLHSGKWEDQVFAGLVAHSQIPRRDEIITLLKRYKDQQRFVTCAPATRGTPKCFEDWLQTAVEVHQNQHILEAIVGTQIHVDDYGSPNPLFKQVSEILDSERWRNRTCERIVTRSVDDYVNTLAPVLRHSGTLTLIDPYISPEPRFFNVVREYLSVLGRGRHSPNISRKVTIHTGDLRTSRNHQEPEQRIRAWERALQPIVNVEKNLSVYVYIWSDEKATEWFHSRFLISSQCCIRFPDGLDVGKGTTVLELKTKAVRDHEEKKFMKASLAFKCLAETEIKSQIP